MIVSVQYILLEGRSLSPTPDDWILHIFSYKMHPNVNFYTKCWKCTLWYMDVFNEHFSTLWDIYGKGWCRRYFSPVKCFFNLAVIVDLLNICWNICPTLPRCRMSPSYLASFPSVRFVLVGPWWQLCWWEKFQRAILATEKHLRSKEMAKCENIYVNQIC